MDGHGAGCSLRYGGNDGFAQINEQRNGAVEVDINGNQSAIDNLLIVVNGRRVVISSE